MENYEFAIFSIKVIKTFEEFKLRQMFTYNMTWWKYVNIVIKNLKSSWVQNSSPKPHSYTLMIIANEPGETKWYLKLSKGNSKLS